MIRTSKLRAKETYDTPLGLDDEQKEINYFYMMLVINRTENNNCGKKEKRKKLQQNLHLYVNSP